MKTSPAKWRKLLRGSAVLLLLCGACVPIGAGDAVVTQRGQLEFPSIHLQGVDRANVSAAAFRGKVLVLNVWATWCPPCRQEMPGLQRLSAKLDSASAVVVGLSVENDDHQVREWLKQTKITFANYLDAGTPSARELLKITAYPQTFFVAPDGRLIARYEGARDWDDPKWLVSIYNVLSNLRAVQK